MQPAEFDIAFALMTAIDGLDLIRAKLLTEMLYRQGALLPFAKLQSATMQTASPSSWASATIGLSAGCSAIAKSGGVEAIDIFFKRIFGELLSRRGYGFHGNIDAGNICMNLVDSARNFRWSLDFYEPL